MASCPAATKDAPKNLGRDEASETVDIQALKVISLFLKSLLPTSRVFRALLAILLLTGLFLFLLELSPLHPQLPNHTPHCASFEVFAPRVRDNG